MIHKHHLQRKAPTVECLGIRYGIHRATGRRDQDGDTFTNPHDVTLESLTPGTTYAIHVQVMGSDNQVTEWCDTVQHMAT